MDARVTEIYFAPEAGSPMCFTHSIRAIAGRGLEGDRYERSAGTYSKFPGGHDVTLFETEALWEFERFSSIVLHPAQTRRNLITEGVKLLDLIDVQFTIGPVRFLGLRPCPPCLYLSNMLKLPIILRGLAHSGGLYAQILSDGVLTTGDQIQIMANDSDNATETKAEPGAAGKPPGSLLSATTHLNSNPHLALRALPRPEAASARVVRP